MKDQRAMAAAILGVILSLGLMAFGYIVTSGALKAKRLDRTVTVKGLAEKEVQANMAIWPIEFSETGNELNHVFSEVQRKTALVVEFLKKNGFTDSEISFPQPSIQDRQAQGYSDKIPFRYSASATITVYTENVGQVRECIKKILELGKQGIAISGEKYQNKTEFLFTQLNTIKPGMIEEATRNAREVAVKFARDSDSTLGKIKKASQGQFSIENRDSTTLHIKKVRVVSTVTYYLTD